MYRLDTAQQPIFGYMWGASGFPERRQSAGANPSFPFSAAEDGRSGSGGEVGTKDNGNKWSDPEKTLGEVDKGGDAKRPREGDYDPSGAMKMEMDDDSEEEDMAPYQPFGMYRKNWIDMCGHVANFDDPTTSPPMRHTDGPVLPKSAEPMDTMEIFSVKVAQITRGLQWPLDVYGDVAVRDSLDHRRNYIFRRRREECQTLTSQQDSLLELIGPSRAVLLLDHPAFEIYLKVKGKEESEDKVLCCDTFGYNNLAYRGDASYAITKVVSSEHSAIEVKFAHVKCSMEATITARIISGSGNFTAYLTACTTSIGEDVVLLDTQGREVSVARDGEVVLQRCVVVVEERAKLILGIKAAQVGDNAESSTTVEKKLTYRARHALRSEGYFVIGSTRLQMMVAWSMLP